MKNSSEGFDQQDNLDVIDAFRGYAILIVIAVHALAYTPELVWPVKRILLMGVFGVQLFFIASALTLMMSWGRSKDPFPLKTKKFMVRRFFRIAPLYYCAILFYWVAYGMTWSDFSFEKLAATLFFYNAWSPYLLPTVPGWMPVPGGWSIGVEFSFYLIFPLLATLITSMRIALAFFAFSFAVLFYSQLIGLQMYPELTLEQRLNIIYFWPPNHLIIFSLGILLYYLVKSPRVRNICGNSRLNASVISCILLIAVVGLSFDGQRKLFDFSNGVAFPTHFLISIEFMIWAMFLLINPNHLVVNKAIVALGKVSFSAYVLHFAILKLVNFIMGYLWIYPVTRYYSIVHAGVLIITAVLATYYLASLTYKYIEKPFMNIGKTLTGTMSQKIQHQQQPPYPS